MKIFIPTKARQKNQVTLNNLPAELLEHTYLVTPFGEEGHTYERVIQVPETVIGISATRQWILENLFLEDDKIFMLDDDLRFSRRYGNGTKLLKCDKEPCLVEMFKELCDWMDTIPVAGVSPRQGNNTVEADFADNTKLTRFLGMNRAFITTERFDLTEVTDDYDFLLWMLRSGKPNRVMYKFAQDQSGSNTLGGASTYRTKEVHERSVETLAKNHPGFVKVVRKTVKSGWFGGDRLDVIIYWKKAFKWGVENRK